jgi:hypothetical protein
MTNGRLGLLMTEGICFRFSRPRRRTRTRRDGRTRSAGLCVASRMAECLLGFNV